jgi:hypothetical protein
MPERSPRRPALALGVGLIWLFLLVATIALADADDA